MKPKPIKFALAYKEPVHRLERWQKGIGPYTDYDCAKKDFKDRFAMSIAKRIIKDWDNLVEYRSCVCKDEFVQEARIDIMGEDVEYKNDELA